MHYVELVAVPLLMLADYTLTILGSRNSAAVYRQHFKAQHYELNPVWRKSVARLQWFNPRHLLVVCAISAILYLVDFAELLPSETFELGVAMLIGAFGTVCGRHLNNLLLFRYLNRRPNEVSGEVQFSLALSLRMSLFNYVGQIPVFMLLIMLAPNRHVVGVFLGLMSTVLAHFVWARKANDG